MLERLERFFFFFFFLRRLGAFLQQSKHGGGRGVQQIKVLDIMYMSTAMTDSTPANPNLQSWSYLQKSSLKNKKSVKDWNMNAKYKNNAVGNQLQR
mmetsp:Transcript_10875/g.31178  ORF Transcript_10875/g.31178 Transcript_10875/m.31178 type:complete len:96 (-) Transcript_10875:1100-1387(-)